MRGYDNIEMEQKGNIVTATVYYFNYEYAGPFFGEEIVPVNEQGRSLYRMEYKLKYLNNHFIVDSGQLFY